MGAAEVIALSDGLLHFQAVQHSQGNIVDEDWLNFAIHALDHPVHAIEHLELHTPLSSKGRIRIQEVEHVGGSKDRHIRVDVLDLLLTKPFSS